MLFGRFGGLGLRVILFPVAELPLLPQEMLKNIGYNMEKKSVPFRAKQKAGFKRADDASYAAHKEKKISKKFAGTEKRPEKFSDDRDEGERIAKKMARLGLASRREAEVMIASGRVTVNGKTLASPAVNVFADDKITVDGKALPAKERTRLWLYHKPAGLLTTARDERDRPTIFAHLPEELPRVVSVGRLDMNTEGLLLLTNDGGLARILELPSTGWVRHYRVRAHGKVTQEQLDSLKDGIVADGVFYGAAEAALEREQGSNVWISISVREGKNREIKNILGALGLSVTRLIRTSFGPFQLGDLETGMVREIRGRTLRDQLGEKLTEKAQLDFDAPIRTPFPNIPVASAKIMRPGQEAVGQNGGGNIEVREKSGSSADAEWIVSGSGRHARINETIEKSQGRAMRNINVWRAKGSTAYARGGKPASRNQADFADKAGDEKQYASKSNGFSRSGHEGRSEFSEKISYEKPFRKRQESNERQSGGRDSSWKERRVSNRFAGGARRGGDEPRTGGGRGYESGARGYGKGGNDRRQSSFGSRQAEGGYRPQKAGSERRPPRKEWEKRDGAAYADKKSGFKQGKGQGFAEKRDFRGKSGDRVDSYGDKRVFYGRKNDGGADNIREDSSFNGRKFDRSKAFSSDRDYEGRGKRSGGEAHASRRADRPSSARSYGKIGDDRRQPSFGEGRAESGRKFIRKEGGSEGFRAKSGSGDFKKGGFKKSSAGYGGGADRPSSGRSYGKNSSAERSGSRRSQETHGARKYGGGTGASKDAGTKGKAGMRGRYADNRR